MALEVDLQKKLRTGSDIELTALLQTKLAHLNSRLESIPSIPVAIVEHIRIFSYEKLDLFDNPAILTYLYEVLRTSKYAIKKSVSGDSSKEVFPYAVLIASVVHRLNRGSHVWPEQIFELYLDDSLGARMWVDATEAKDFVKSLLHWTLGSVRQEVVSSSKQLIQKSKLQDDDSSGDEEILEEGGDGNNSTILTKSSIVHDAMEIERSSTTTPPAVASKLLELTLRLLTARINPSSSSSSALASGLQGGTWTVIVTIQSLVSLAEVRLIAAQCLERWLLNPALFEHVCQLLRSIALCLKLAPSSTSTDNCTSALSINSMNLLPSDSTVVGEIVRMRSKIKSSHSEIYKAILIAMVNRNPCVAKQVFLLIMQDELTLHTGSSKIQETVKLLLALMNTIDDKVPSKPPNSTINGNKKFSTVSTLLGNAMGTLATTNYARLVDVSVGGGGSPFLKSLIELLVRIERGLGVIEMDQPACLEGVLDSLRHPSTNFTHMPELHSLVAEVAVCLQLVVGNDAVASDNRVAAADRPSLIGATTSRGGSSAKAGPGAGRGKAKVIEKASSIFLSTSAASSREKAKYVEVPSATTANAGHLPTYDKAGAMKVCLKCQEITMTWMLQQYSSHSGKDAEWWLNWIHRVLLLPDLQFTTTLTPSRHHTHIKIDVDKASFILLRDNGMLSDKLLILICECSFKVSRSIVHIVTAIGFVESCVQRSCKTKLSVWPASVGSSGAVVVENPSSLGFLFGLCLIRPHNWIGDSCEIPLSVVGSLECGDETSSFCRNGDDVSNSSISSLLISPPPPRKNRFEPGTRVEGNYKDWGKWYPAAVVCYNPFEGTYNLDYDDGESENLAEHLVRRPVLVEPDKLLNNSDFSSLNCGDHLEHALLGTKSSTEVAGTTSPTADLTATEPTHDEPERAAGNRRNRTAGPRTKKPRILGHALPLLVYRTFYWRTCLVCYTLGCARPDTLGKYLWDNIPAVQTLMVMSIAGRFFHPPSAATVDIADLEYDEDGSMLEENRQGRLIAYRPDDSRVVVLLSETKVDIRHSVSVSSDDASVSDVAVAPLSVQNIPLVEAETAIRATEDSLWAFFFGGPTDQFRRREVVKSNPKKRSKVDQEAAKLEKEREKLAERKEMAANARAQRATRFAKREAADEDDWMPSKRLKKDAIDEEDEELMVIVHSEEPKGFLPQPLPALMQPSLPPPLLVYLDAPAPQELMLLQTPIARAPTPEIIKSLRNIDAKFNFGALLRQSVDPDFIVKTIYSNQDKATVAERIGTSTVYIGRASTLDRQVRRDAIEKSSSWLLPAIAVNAEVILKRIPASACTHLLLMIAYKIYVKMQELSLWNHDKTSGDNIASWADPVLFISKPSLTSSFLQESNIMQDLALLHHFVSKLASYPIGDEEDEVRMVLLSELSGNSGVAEKQFGYHRGRVARMVTAMLACYQVAQTPRSIIEEVLLVGPNSCNFMAYFIPLLCSTEYTASITAQALLRHAQHDGLEVIENCIHALLNVPEPNVTICSNTAIELAKYVMNHRPELVRKIVSNIAGENLLSASRLIVSSFQKAESTYAIERFGALQDEFTYRITLKGKNSTTLNVSSGILHLVLMSLVIDKSRGNDNEDADSLLTNLQSRGAITPPSGCTIQTLIQPLVNAFGPVMTGKLFNSFELLMRSLGAEIALVTESSRAQFRHEAVASSSTISQFHFESENPKFDVPAPSTFCLMNQYASDISLYMGLSRSLTNFRNLATNPMDDVIDRIKAGNIECYNELLLSATQLMISLGECLDINSVANTVTESCTALISAAPSMILILVTPTFPNDIAAQFTHALSRLLHNADGLLTSVAEAFCVPAWDVITTTGIHVGGGFHEGEIVMAEDGGASNDIYPAKILQIYNPSELVFQYYVHYQGWAKKYDAWIESDQVCKRSDEDGKMKLKEQAEVKYMQARRAEKAKRREQQSTSRKKNNSKKKGDDDEINGDEFDDEDDDSDLDRCGVPGSKRKDPDDIDFDDEHEFNALKEDPSDDGAHQQLEECPKGGIESKLLMDLLMTGIIGVQGWDRMKRVLYVCYLQRPEAILAVVSVEKVMGSIEGNTVITPPIISSQTAAGGTMGGNVAKGKRKFEEYDIPAPPAHSTNKGKVASPGHLDIGSEKVTLFHVLMLGESEALSSNSGFGTGQVPSIQSDLAISARGADYLHSLTPHDSIMDPTSVLDSPLLLALQILSSRLPIPSTLDTGTAIHSLEEYNTAAFKAARKLVLVAAKRHPVLFLRVVPQLWRDVSVSIKLAKFASQSNGLKYQSFKSNAGQSNEPIPPVLIASNFNNRERVSVVFKSRSITEINEVLWDTLRRALTLLSSPVFSGSSGRGDGQTSIHDVVSVMCEVGRKRSAFRGAIGLGSSTLRKIVDWEDEGFKNKNFTGYKEGDWEDEMSRIATRGESYISGLQERWDVLG